MKNKKNRKSSLQKNLFKRYVFAFIIFQILYLVGFNFAMNYLTKASASHMYSADDVYKQIDTEGLDKFLSQAKLPDKSYIEVLDLNYKVQKNIKGPHEEGYQYAKDDVIKIVNQKDGNVHEYLLSKTQEILLISENTSLNVNSAPFTIAFLILLVMMVVSYIIFFKAMAKSVSKSLGKPLKLLFEGVNAFKNKEYGHRIEYNANNELDDLKDAFNSMASTIEDEMNRRIEAQDINKQLILDITHDLKTPLTNIEGYSRLLRDDENLPQEKKNKYLDVVIANSNRTNDMIKNLFDFIYADYSNLKIRKENVDFCEMLRRLLTDYIPEFENNNRDYDIDIPDYPVYVTIDSRMMERAVCNIINNFLKYGGDNTKITFKLKDNNSDIQLTIADNGPGIPKEKCSKIFLPFVRADASRNSKTGGTGLGLAITKKVIESTGGTIKLDSDTGKGCTFTITIPKIF